MSAHDDIDDPEDVTLWAGRLRPWPAAPVDPPATVSRAEPIPAEGAEADDQTIRSPRSVPAPDAISSPRAPLGDETIPSTRAADAVAGPGPERVATEPAGGVDDDTAPARPRIPPATIDDTDAVEVTAPARSRAALAASATVGDSRDDDTDDSTAARPRAGAGRSSVGGADASGMVPADPPPGRAAMRRAAAAPVDTDAARRAARVPDPQGRERYEPRPDDVVRVTRRETPSRSEGAPDAALVRPRAPRRGVGRTVLGAVTIVVLLVAAGAALVLLTL